MVRFFDHSDYRDILRDEFARRASANASYSQSAFSRDIAIAPSRLCEVLGEKQGLSVSVAQKICDKLGYRSLERNYFLDLVVSVHGRSRAAREAAIRRLRMNYQHKRFDRCRDFSQDVGFVAAAERVQKLIMVLDGGCHIEVRLPGSRLGLLEFRNKLMDFFFETESMLTLEGADVSGDLGD